MKTMFCLLPPPLPSLRQCAAVTITSLCGLSTTLAEQKWLPDASLLNNAPILSVLAFCLASGVEPGDGVWSAWWYSSSACSSRSLVQYDAWPAPADPADPADPGAPGAPGAPGEATGPPALVEPLAPDGPLDEQ